jgi:predicted ATPase
MGHLRSFGLNNFRVFNTETDFELRPITILTGSNSSGKSSFIKGLQVMKLAFSAKKPFLDSLKEINLNEVKHLGGFDLLKNRNNDSPVISFKLPFVLKGVFNQLVLKLNYISDRSALKNAFLESLVVTDKQEKIVLYNTSFVDYDSWNQKINFSELYQFLRDYAEISQEYDILEKSLYKDMGPNAERVKSENYDQVLKQLEVLSPIRAFYLEHEADPHLEGSFYEPIDDYEKSVHRRSFNSNNFLFPFVFLYKSEYTEEYVNNNLSEDEIITLTDLRKRIGEMTAEELKAFYKELVEAEKKILQLMECNLYTDGEQRKEFFIADDLIDFKKNKSYFYELAGKDLQDKAEFHPNDSYIIDILKDSHDFFMKNNINRKFLMLSTKNLEIFEKNFNLFFHDFCKKGFEEAINTTRRRFQFMEFITSNRHQSGRIFQNDSSSYLNKVLSEFYRTKSDNHDHSIHFLNHYVKEFKIAEKVIIVPNDDSLTSSIFFIKNKQKINIADLGYGVSQLLPILIRIAININVMDVRYGLPEFIAGYWHEPVCEASIIVIEEPETNLHPALQSKLADLFVECYQKYNIQFIIETHSEYFIRKLQYKIAKQEFNHKDANIYYFNDPESEAYKSEVVYKIDIEKNGVLSRPFGAGFFDESNNLNMSLYLLTKDSLN